MTPDVQASTVVTGLRLAPGVWAHLRAYARSINGDLSALASAAIAEYLEARADVDGVPLPSSDPVPRLAETGYGARRRPTHLEIQRRVWWAERIQRTRGRPLDPV